MSYCNIIPRVKNQINDELGDSNLYQDLLKYTSNNREIANDIYYRATSKTFTDTFKDVLVFDEYNQPTFESLYKVGELNKYVGENNEINNIKKSLGLLNNNVEKTFGTQSEAFNITNKFNNEHILKDKYVALPTRIINDISKVVSYAIQFVKNSFSNQQYRLAYQLNNNLHNTIVDKFKRMNISVGTITDLEDRLGIKGIVDFDIAKNADKSIVEAVRIAKGELGTDSLLEEHVHMVVDVLRNEPIMVRAFNYVLNNNLQEEILDDEYEQYSIQYDNDVNKLTYEALGKLIYNQIKGISTNSKASFLINRVWNRVQNWAINTFSNDDLKLTKVALSTFVNDVYLSEKYTDFLKPENINMSGRMYNIIDVSNKNKNIKNALENTLKLENQRYKLNKLKSKVNYQPGNLSILSKLKNSIIADKNYKTAIGVIEYIENFSTMAEDLKEKLNNISNENSLTINKKAAIFTEIKSFTDMSKKVIDPLINALNSDSSIDEELIDIDGNKTSFKEIKTNLINALQTQQKEIIGLSLDNLKFAKDIMVSFYTPFFNENPAFVESLQKAYKNLYNIENANVNTILEYGLYDLNWFQKFCTTATQSNDPLIQLNEHIIKQFKNTVKDNTLNEVNMLKSMRRLLENKGVKNDKFMLEVDDKGNKTGHFISEGHWGKFEIAKKEYFDSLDKQVTENKLYENNAEKMKYNWIKANTISDKFNNMIPNPKIYPNSEFHKLNEAQKEYYDYIIRSKMMLDSYLPNHYKNTYLAPQMTQDLYNTIFQSKDITNTLKNSYKEFTANFEEQIDETGYGSKQTVENFDGSTLKTVPIYFVNKLKDMERLNTDTAGSMMSYSLMANHYKEFSQIADIMEMTKLTFDTREYATKKFGSKDAEGNITKGATSIFNKFGAKLTFIKTNQNSKSNAFQVFDHMIDTNMYDIIKANEQLGRWKINRIGDAFLNFNSMNKMAFNVLSQTSNVLNSRWQTFIEASAGEYIKYKNLVKADSIFMQNIFPMISEVGQRIKINKIPMMMDFFDVKMEFNGNVRGINMNEKNIASKVFSTDMFYMLNNMAEFHAYATVALSVLDNIKVKDSTGKQMTLWEALEKKDVQLGNSKLGQYLSVKEGLTTLDGKPVDKQFIFKTGRLMQGLGKSMFGVYSNTEKTMVNKWLIGRMAMQFRGYFIPNLIRRFGGRTFDFDYNKEIEGYFYTLGNVIIKNWRDIIKLKFTKISKNLDDVQKNNIKRALTELGMFTTLLLSVFALGKYGDTDDDMEKNSWFYNYLRYSTVRLGSEVGSLIPPAILTEIPKQIASPIPSMNLFNAVGNTLNFSKSLDRVERGAWKDHLYIEKYISEMIPGIRAGITVGDVTTMRTQRKFFETGMMNIGLTKKDD